jgi:hypothetical protein
VNGATITLTKGCPRLALKPAGTLATLHVVLPFGPLDGDFFRFTTTQEITDITVTAPEGATVDNGTGTVPPNGSMLWFYNKGDLNWDSV